MDAVLNEISNLILPAVVALLVGGLKYLGPKIREKVPSFVWPVAVFGLARAGSAVCAATGLPCSGNPFDWSPETINALAVVAVAGIVQKISKKATPKVTELLDKVKSVGS